MTFGQLLRRVGVVPLSRLCVLVRALSENCFSHDVSMMLIIERNRLTMSAKPSAESKWPSSRRSLDSSDRGISVVFLLCCGGAIGVFNKSMMVSVSEENMVIGVCQPGVCAFSRD